MLAPVVIHTNITSTKKYTSKTTTSTSTATTTTTTTTTSTTSTTTTTPTTTTTTTSTTTTMAETDSEHTGGNPYTHVLSTAKSIETIAVGFFDEKEVNNPLVNFIPMDHNVEDQNFESGTVEITSTGLS